MGTVVTLPPPRASSARVARTNEANILLFMGVRYVRDLEPAQPAQPVALESPSDTEHELPPLEIA